VAWGPGDAQQEDVFSAAEREIKAVVSASWWPTARAEQREHAVAGRAVELPDGTQWLFGAWARWYLCPPPYATSVRRSGRAATGVSGLPPHVIPLGPDFDVTAPAALPFIGADLSPLTARVRATVESAAALSAADFPRGEEPPRWLAEFSPDAPSTVAACWGVMLWCASAPVFDARRDADLLALWEPYRAVPLPRIEGPRWLTPPTLEDLVALYAERLRAHNVQSAVVILRTMWATASALRDEPRFTARADALLAILNATLSDPQQDYGALPHGDAAVAQLWVTRCPPNLSPGLRAESSPGDGFRHLFYDLAQCLVPVAGEPGDPTFVEPRLIAASLLAADLAIVRQDVVAEVTRWLDPEIRFTVQAMISQQGHPLRRRFWPIDQRLPPQLRDGSAGNREELLATMFAVALAWCRLGGGIPARPRGFPAPVAILAEMIGLERATATTPAAPPPPPQQWGAPPPPNVSRQGPQQQWGAQPPAQAVPGPAQQWGAPQPAAEAQQPAQGQPWGTQPPYQRTARAEFGPDGQLILPGQDARPAEPAQGEQAAGLGQPGVPYQTGGRRPVIQRGPTADELAQLELQADIALLAKENEIEDIEAQLTKALEHNSLKQQRARDAIELMESMFAADEQYKRDLDLLYTRRDDIHARIVGELDRSLALQQAQYTVTQRKVAYASIVQRAQLLEGRLRNLVAQRNMANLNLGSPSIVFGWANQLEQAENRLARAKSKLMDWVVGLEYLAVRPFMDARIQVLLARNTSQLSEIADSLTDIQNRCGGAINSNESVISLRDDILRLDSSLRDAVSGGELTPAQALRSILKQGSIAADTRVRFSADSTIGDLVSRGGVLAASFDVNLSDFANLGATCNAKVQEIAIQLVGQDLGTAQPTVGLAYDGTSAVRSCQPDIEDIVQAIGPDATAFGAITMFRTPGRVLAPTAGLNTFGQSNQTLIGLPLASQYTVIIDPTLGQNASIKWDNLEDVQILFRFASQDFYPAGQCY